MNVFVRQNVMPATVGLLMAVLIINSFPIWRDFFARFTRAITWDGVVVSTPVVSPGGTLIIKYRAIVNKQCPSDLRTFIIAPDDTAPVRFPPIFGGYVRPSNGEWRDINVSIVIPQTPDASQPNWIDGEYIYRTIATRYCPEGVEVDSNVPDVKFKLEVP